MNPGDKNEAIECRLVRMRGRVQGVGYRDACVRHALATGVAGWVRNRADGSVEAMLQGSRRELDAMCKWLRDGVPGARVDALELTQLPPPVDRLDRFDQLPTL